MPELSKYDSGRVQGLLSEDDLVLICKMSNRFLKCAAYGIRMHNADIDARMWSAGNKPPCISGFDVILRLGSVPDGSVE